MIKSGQTGVTLPGRTEWGQLNEVERHQLSCVRVPGDENLMAKNEGADERIKDQETLNTFTSAIVSSWESAQHRTNGHRSRSMTEETPRIRHEAVRPRREELVFPAVSARREEITGG